MAKRKTLKQKEKADMRKIEQPLPRHMESSPLSSSPFSQVSYTFSSGNHKPIVNQPASITTQYVKHDIVKTTLVSVIIIGLELLLFLTLHQHILRIPFVTY